MSFSTAQNQAFPPSQYHSRYTPLLGASGAAFKYAASISPHCDNWFLVGFQKPWQIKWELNLILQVISVDPWVDIICSCRSTANLKLCKDARRFKNLRLPQEIKEC